MIDFDRLKSHRFDPVFQTYTARDTMLYALGLNIGADPMDSVDLPFVTGDPPLVVPTMPMALARLGPWMKDPSVGIDYGRVVVGEIDLSLFAPIPAAATVRGEHRILRVTDKGEGRGALVTVLRELFDIASGEKLAAYEQLSFCRGDGGFAVDGRHDPPAAQVAWDVEDRPPDSEVQVRTAPHQALVYRLSGDMNPLHSDPETARRAGFERPILHGLATMGMAGHALARRVAADGALRGLSGRLAAPVIPGEVLTLQSWRADGGALFRLVKQDGREAVSRGRAKIHYVG